MYYCVIENKNKDIVGIFCSLSRAIKYADNFNDTDTIVAFTENELNAYLRHEIKIISKYTID